MDIIKAAEKFVLKEIKKYSSPIFLHWEIANKKRIELSKKLKADEELVRIGTMLMDVKIGQALKEKRLQNHVRMSVAATKDFLEKFSLSKEREERIINCTAAHHGTIPYICLEAEICANTDCFRFLSPRGFIGFLLLLGKEGMGFKKVLVYTEKKLEEKYEIISLDVCKEEAN
jgi:hypothetical protein